MLSGGYARRSTGRVSALVEPVIGAVGRWREGQDQL